MDSKDSGTEGTPKITKGKERVSAEDQNHALTMAIGAHKMTGGAPVEVSNGGFKVKIGAWPDEGMRSIIGDIGRALIGMLDKPPKDKPQN